MPLTSPAVAIEEEPDDRVTPPGFRTVTLRRRAHRWLTRAARLEPWARDARRGDSAYVEIELPEPTDDDIAQVRLLLDKLVEAERRI